MPRIAAEKTHGKPCRVCGGTLRYARDGKCVPCRAKHVAKHLTPIKRREYKARYKGRYIQKTNTQKLLNMSHETFERLRAQQKGRCAICKTQPVRRLHIDHCHNSKRFRGLLCGRCNTGLGQFLDNPDILRAAVEYLENNAWDL